VITTTIKKVARARAGTVKDVNNKDATIKMNIAQEAASREAMGEVGICHKEATTVEAADMEEETKMRI